MWSDAVQQFGSVEVHTGETAERDKDYFGRVLERFRHAPRG